MTRLANLTANVGYSVAAASGIALWVMTMVISGRREAWDAPIYWNVAYPLAVIVSAVLGYVVPQRPWRWAVTLMLAQAGTLAVTAASFQLLPLGLITFAMLSLPLVVSAKLASVIRRRGQSAGAGELAKDRSRARQSAGNRDGGH